MKVKNTSGTIITIGENIILPDGVAEITDERFINNSAVDFLIETGRLSVVKKAAKKSGKAEEPPAESGKAEEPTAGNGGTEQAADGKETDDGKNTEEG